MPALRKSTAQSNCVAYKLAWVRDRIRLPSGIAAALLKQARKNPGEECCGLLAGCHGAITRAFPAINTAPQPTTAYEIAPEELFGLMRQIRTAALEFLGIYHSHPGAENVPSATDVDRAYYPDVAYFIVSPRLDAQRPIRAFSIRDGVASEFEIQIV